MYDIVPFVYNVKYMQPTLVVWLLGCMLILNRLTPNRMNSFISFEQWYSALLTLELDDAEIIDASVNCEIKILLRVDKYYIWNNLIKFKALDRGSIPPQTFNAKARQTSQYS